MTASSSTPKPPCKNLVLDAGPLLSLSPLRGLAEVFYTVPQVLNELKDKRAREHFEQLGLQAGVRIQVQSPDPQSLGHGRSRIHLQRCPCVLMVCSHPVREEDWRLFRAVYGRSLRLGSDIFLARAREESGKRGEGR